MGALNPWKEIKRLRGVIEQAEAALAAKTAEVARLNEEMEELRTRLLVAQRRLKHQDAPREGVIRVRNGAELRAINDRLNHDFTQEQETRRANTSQR